MSGLNLLAGRGKRADDETKPDETAATPDSEATAEQPAAAATEAGTETATADSRVAERERIDGILTCEEAKGRTELARHLALKTDMGVDDAKAVLASAPVEAGKAETDRLSTAMGTVKNPQVGPGEGESADAGDNPDANAAAMIGDWRRATGRPAAKSA